MDYVRFLRCSKEARANELKDFLNKEKNAEIKGFLRWLEEEIGAPVEELTNKTAIKEYYEAGFDVLAGALAKNKKKLKESISGGKDAKETEIAG